MNKFSVHFGQMENSDLVKFLKSREQTAQKREELEEFIGEKSDPLKKNNEISFDEETQERKEVLNGEFGPFPQPYLIHLFHHITTAFVTLVCISPSEKSGVRELIIESANP